MRVVGLNGESFNWNPAKLSYSHQNTSTYHKRVKTLLTKLFPFDKIYEEVTLLGSKYMNKDLSADFYIPSIKLIVEIHGEQHYKFTSYFHDNILEFHRGKARDKNKKQWCYVNNIKYLALKYNEDEQKWEEKIREIQNE